MQHDYKFQWEIWKLILVCYNYLCPWKFLLFIDKRKKQRKRLPSPKKTFIFNQFEIKIKNSHEKKERLIYDIYLSIYLSIKIPTLQKKSVIFNQFKIEIKNGCEKREALLRYLSIYLSIYLSLKFAWWLCIWIRIFLSDTNSLNTTIWFQVSISIQ